jgi:hypothetical protein
MLQKTTSLLSNATDILLSKYNENLQRIVIFFIHDLIDRSDRSMIYEMSANFIITEKIISKSSNG